MKNNTETPRRVAIDFLGNSTVAHVVYYTEDKDGVHEYHESAASFCNPADKYDPFEGARIALARVLDREPFPKQAEEKPEGPDFRVGDIVKLLDKPIFSDNCRGLVGEIIRLTPNGTSDVRLKNRAGRICTQSVPTRIMDRFIRLVYRKEADQK